ncbi:unnamed protein product, partial [Choristocarpus tenellus]
KWGVRPDLVLRDRYGDKSKGALSSFWQQDYKRIRVDWRALSGLRHNHFVLTLKHYMHIDGPSRDTPENRIKYILKDRVRDDTHMGIVDSGSQ